MISTWWKFSEKKISKPPAWIEPTTFQSLVWINQRENREEKETDDKKRQRKYVSEQGQAERYQVTIQSSAALLYCKCK